MSQFRTRSELQAFVRLPRDEQISLLIKAAQLRISTVGIDQAFREAVNHAWDFGGMAACEHVLGRSDFFEKAESVQAPEVMQ